MQFWLLKSEPNVYSFQNLVESGEGIWDGVRNYQARNNLRAMQVGDQALFYHSNIGKEVVGVVQITTMAFPDPTTTDPKWLAVGVVPVLAFDKPVSLQAIKAHPALQEIALVKHSRLSVMPIAAEAFNIIIALGNQTQIHEA